MITLINGCLVATEKEKRKAIEFKRKVKLCYDMYNTSLGYYYYYLISN